MRAVPHSAAHVPTDGESPPCLTQARGGLCRALEKASMTDAFWGGGGQAMDGLWTEVCGQQKQSNDPGNNQHILNTPIIGRR